MSLPYRYLLHWVVSQPKSTVIAQFINLLIISDWRGGGDSSPPKAQMRFDNGGYDDLNFESFRYYCIFVIVRMSNFAHPRMKMWMRIVQFWALADADANVNINPCAFGIEYFIILLLNCLLHRNPSFDNNSIVDRDNDIVSRTQFDHCI